MKNRYLVIIIVFLSLQIKAQYTITPSSNPIPGDIESYSDLDSTGLFFGSSGTSQIWNYSAVTAYTINPPTSYTYVPMSSVPNNSLFPLGTIGADDGAGNYGVLSNTSSKFEYYGHATATATNCWVYSDPLKLYDIPFTYGSTSTDSFALSLPTDTTTGTFTTTGTGTGILQLPTATYTNVLKLNYVLYEKDTYPGSVYDYTVLINQYYSAASKFLLLEVQTTTTSVTSGTNITFYYNKYGKAASFGLTTNITNKENRLSFNVFPNPVSNGELFISSNNPSFGKMTIEINNVLGQCIKIISFENQSGTDPKKINVSDLTKGIYYLKITGKEVTKTQKIIIE